MPGTFTRKRNVYSMQPPNMAPSIKRRLITVATISMFVSATVVVASSYIFVLGLVNSQRSSSNNSSNQSVENIQHPGLETNSTSYNNIRHARSLSEDPTSIAPVFLTSTETETTTASGQTKTSTRTAPTLALTRQTTEDTSDLAPLGAAHINAARLVASSSSTPSSTAKSTITEDSRDLAPLGAAHINAATLIASSPSTLSSTANSTKYPSTTTENALDSHETTPKNTSEDDSSPLAAAHINALNLSASPSSASSTTAGKTSSPNSSSSTTENALGSSNPAFEKTLGDAPEDDSSPLAAAHINALNLSAPPSSASSTTAGKTSSPDSSSSTTENALGSSNPAFEKTLGDAPEDDSSPLAAAHVNALNLSAPPSSASSITAGKTSSPNPSSSTAESGIGSSDTTSDKPLSFSPLASAHQNALNLVAPSSSTSLSTAGPSSKLEPPTTENTAQDTEVVSKKPSSRETPEGAAAIFNGPTETTRPESAGIRNETGTSESGNSSTTARPGPLAAVTNAVKNGTLFSNWSQKWQNFRSKWANSKLFVLTNSGVVLTAAFLQFVSAASISIIVKRTTAEGKAQRLASRWIVFNAIVFIILTLGLVSFAAMGSDPEKLSGSHLVLPHEPQGSSIGFLSKSIISNIYIFIILADVIGLFFLILTSSCLLRHIEPPPHREFDVCQ